MSFEFGLTELGNGLTHKTEFFGNLTKFTNWSKGNPEPDLKYSIPGGLQEI